MTLKMIWLWAVLSNVAAMIAFAYVGNHSGALFFFALAVLSAVAHILHAERERNGGGSWM